MFIRLFFSLLATTHLGAISQDFKDAYPPTNTHIRLYSACVLFYPEIWLDVIEQALADAQQRQAHSERADLA